MISPELLRRFPFFNFCDDAQLKAVAMLAEEVEVDKGSSVFETEQSADEVYVLIEGSIDLYFKVVDRDDPGLIKEFFLSEFNPGDIFGLSALFAPYRRSMTAKVMGPSKLIKIDAMGLRGLLEGDTAFAAGLFKAAAQTFMHRVNETRAQLAAARA